MNFDAMDKIEMLKGSQKCFVCGLLALLPVIGLPFGFYSFWIASRVRRFEMQFWNAARPYRVWGTICAVIGIFSGLGIFILFAIAAYNAIFEPY